MAGRAPARAFNRRRTARPEAWDAPRAAPENDAGRRCQQQEGSRIGRRGVPKTLNPVNELTADMKRPTFGRVSDRLRRQAARRRHAARQAPRISLATGCRR